MTSPVLDKGWTALCLNRLLARNRAAQSAEQTKPLDDANLNALPARPRAIAVAAMSKPSNSQLLSLRRNARFINGCGALCSALALFCFAQPVEAQEPPARSADLPPLEPIISDEEFNSAIPELDLDDAELDQELESIGDFERRFDAEEDDGPQDTSNEAPLKLPELADGDLVEEISDAPIRDAELAKPLTPIDEFQVADVQLAEVTTDESNPPELKYDVALTGLDALDDLTDINLAGSFRNLSALEQAGGKAANIAMLAARLTEDKALLAQLLRSEGWYSAEVTTRIDRGETGNGQQLTAVIDVAPGPRYALADIQVQAEPTVPTDLIASNIGLKVGEPIVAARILGAEAQIATVLPQSGYPFAKIEERDILLNPETGEGIYTMPVTIGPRARFGGFEVTGNPAFDADHVAVIARFERGELYDSRELDDLRKAMVATGLFNTVAVSPKRTGESASAIAGDDTQFVTMLIKQDAGPQRTIAGSAGYGTGQGFRLEGSWSHRNLFPPEGALTASVVAGTKEQGAGLNFRRANAGQRDRTFEIGLNALRANYDAFEAFTGRLGGLVSYVSTPLWQKRVTYAYGAEAIASVEEEFDPILGRKVDRTYFIGALTGQAGFDTSDDLLNPTSGFRLNALVQPEGSLQGDFSPYVRMVLDGSAYVPFGNSIVLAGRLKMGSIQGASRQSIAPSRRLYAGGGGSVRGFGFQGLGPKVLEPNPNFDPSDPDETAEEFLIRPIGGRSLVEAAAEVRYRFGDYGIVGFVDAGQVYESARPGFSDIRYGVGLGGRFYTNFGPLRLDVATPLGRREGESRVTVYVSIGQAF